MTTRCLNEWGESHFEVFVPVENSFRQVDKVDAFSIFQVAAKLARGTDQKAFDAIHIMRAHIPNVWCITLEATAQTPEAEDKIVAEYYVRRNDD